MTIFRRGNLPLYWLLLLSSSLALLLLVSVLIVDATPITFTFDDQTLYPFVIDDNSTSLEGSLQLSGFIAPFGRVIIQNIVVDYLTSDLIFFPGSSLIINNVTTLTGGILFGTGQTLTDADAKKSEYCDSYKNSKSFETTPAWWGDKSYFTKEAVQQDCGGNSLLICQRRVQNISIVIMNSYLTVEFVPTEFKPKPLASQSFAGIFIQSVFACPLIFDSDLTNVSIHSASEAQLHLVVRNNKIRIKSVEDLQASVGGIFIFSTVNSLSLFLLESSARVFSVRVQNNDILVERPTLSSTTSSTYAPIAVGIVFGVSSVSSSSGTLFYEGPFSDNNNNSNLPLLSFSNNKINVSALVLLGRGLLVGRLGEIQNFSYLPPDTQQLQHLFYSTSSSSSFSNFPTAPTISTTTNSQWLIFDVEVENNSVIVDGTGNVENINVQIEFPLRPRVSIRNNVLTTKTNHLVAVANASVAGPWNFYSIRIENELRTFPLVNIQNNTISSYSFQATFGNNGSSAIKREEMNGIAIMLSSAEIVLIRENSFRSEQTPMVDFFVVRMVNDIIFTNTLVHFLTRVSVSNNTFRQSAVNHCVFVAFYSITFGSLEVKNNFMNTTCVRRTYGVHFAQERIDGSDTLLVENNFFTGFAEDVFFVGRKDTEASIGLGLIPNILVLSNTEQFFRVLINENACWHGFVDFGYFNASLIRIAFNQILTGTPNEAGLYFNRSYGVAAVNAPLIVVEYNTYKDKSHKNANFVTMSTSVPKAGFAMDQFIVRHNVYDSQSGGGVAFFGMSRGQTSTAVDSNMYYTNATLHIANNSVRYKLIPGIAFSLHEVVPLLFPPGTVAEPVITVFSWTSVDLRSLRVSGNTFVGLTRFSSGFSTRIRQLTLAIPCSTFNGEPLNDRLVRNLLALPQQGVVVKVINLLHLAGQEFADIGGNCAYTPSASRTKVGTKSQELTLTEQVVPTLPETDTVTMSASLAVPPVPTEDDVQLPSALQSVSSAGAGATTAASVFVGPQASLDAGRALSLLSILARCKNYDENLAQVNAMMPATKNSVDFEAKKAENKMKLQKMYADLYMSRSLSWPETYLPGVCYGNRNGQCLRGGVAGGFMMIGIGIALSFLFGLFLTLRAEKEKIKEHEQLAERQQAQLEYEEILLGRSGRANFSRNNNNNIHQREGMRVFGSRSSWGKVFATIVSKPELRMKILCNARLPLFVVQAVALQLSGWMPHAMAFLIADGIPLMDRISFGVIPIFFFWLFPTIGFCYYLQRFHLFEESHRGHDSTESARARKQRRMKQMHVEPVYIWFPRSSQLETSVEYFPSAVQFKMIQFVQDLFSPLGSKSITSAAATASATGTTTKTAKEASDLASSATTSSIGRIFFAGDYCWSQGPTKSSVNLGFDGSFLKQCGSIINKFYGPLSFEGKKRWFMTERLEKSRKRNENENGNAKNYSDSASAIDAKPQPWRCRVAPFTVFVNSAWTMAACFAQSVAAIHPTRCFDTMVVMTVVCVLAWALTLWCRPSLSRMKNIAAIVADTFVLVACVLALVAMKYSNSLSEATGSFSSSATSGGGDAKNNNNNIDMEKLQEIFNITSVAQTILLISVFSILIGTIPQIWIKFLIVGNYVKCCTKAELKQLMKTASADGDAATTRVRNEKTRMFELEMNKILFGEERKSPRRGRNHFSSINNNEIRYDSSSDRSSNSSSISYEEEGEEVELRTFRGRNAKVTDDYRRGQTENYFVSNPDDTLPRPFVDRNNNFAMDPERRNNYYKNVSNRELLHRSPRESPSKRQISPSNKNKNTVIESGYKTSPERRNDHGATRHYYNYDNSKNNNRSNNHRESPNNKNKKGELPRHERELERENSSWPRSRRRQSPGGRGQREAFSPTGTFGRRDVSDHLNDPRKNFVDL